MPSKLFLLFLLLTILSSCAAAKQTVKETARERNWQFDTSVQGTGTRVSFIPRGAYIVGLSRDNAFLQNTWIRLTPGDDWPEQEPRPTLLAGRIAERLPTAARIEILALHPDFRETLPHIESYDTSHASIAQIMHSIAKKLSFSTETIAADAESVYLPLTRTDGMEGNEIYCAYSISQPDDRSRLGSRCHALLTAESIDDSGSILRRRSGIIPSDAAFVLLDAPPPPAFSIALQIDALSDGMTEKVSRAAAEMLNLHLPGMEFIRIEKTGRALTAEELSMAMGQAQTDTLLVRLFNGPDGPLLASQSLRLMNPREAGFHAVIASKDAQTAAAAAIAESLKMLGYHGSIIWLIEKLYRDSDDIEVRAALSPALAEAYHDIGRDDWALELALEQKGYAGTASGTPKVTALAAAAAAAAAAGQTEEFAPTIDKIAQNLNHLPSAWKTMFARTLLTDPEHFSGIYEKTVQKMRKNESGSRFNAYFNWYDDEFNTMAACAARIDDNDDICTAGADHAQSPFAQLWYRTAAAVNGSSASSLMSLTQEIDSIGAPWLAQTVWSALAQMSQNRDSTSFSWLNAAAYARLSQRTQTFLMMMFEMTRFLLSNDTDADQEEFVHAISGWRALDWRAQIAALCMLRARKAAPGEAIDFLLYAAELYISIGDADNAAAAFESAASKLNESGQKDTAALYTNRAKLFSAAVSQPISPKE